MLWEVEEELPFPVLAMTAAVSLCAWSFRHRSDCIRYSIESGKTMKGVKTNCDLSSLLCSRQAGNQDEKDVSGIILE